MGIGPTVPAGVATSPLFINKGVFVKTISGALVVLFIGLKLANVTDMSWWWLLVPTVGIFSLHFVLVYSYVLYVQKWGSPADKYALRMKGYL